VDLSPVQLLIVLVIVLLVPALRLLFRFVPERLGTIILSALVAHTAWHWMSERGQILWKFPRPAVDAALFADALRWLLALVILAAALWLVNGVLRRTGWLAADETPSRNG